MGQKEQSGNRLPFKTCKNYYNIVGNCHWSFRKKLVEYASLLKSTANIC